MDAQTGTGPSQIAVGGRARSPAPLHLFPGSLGLWGPRAWDGVDLHRSALAFSHAREAMSVNEATEPRESSQTGGRSSAD